MKSNQRTQKRPIGRRADRARERQDQSFRSASSFSSTVCSFFLLTSSYMQGTTNSVISVAYSNPPMHTSATG